MISITMIILNNSSWDLKKEVPTYQASTSQAQKNDACFASSSRFYQYSFSI